MTHIDQDVLFDRTTAVIDPQRLRGKSVLIAGAGSGGGRVCDELVRCGVGRVGLLDLSGEKLDAHNLIRHVLGRRDLGRPKTDAMKDHLLNINPAVVVETHELDATRQPDRLAEIVLAYDLTIGCFDNAAACLALNKAVVAASRPAVFGSVLDGGVGGEVIVVRPEAACWRCVQAALNREVKPEHEPVSRPEDYTSGIVPGVRATAALNLDIAQIALNHARAALGMLLPDDPAFALLDAHNYLLMANRPLAGVFDRALQCWRRQFARDEGCLVCAVPPDPAAADRAVALLASIPEVP